MHAQPATGKHNVRTAPGPYPLMAAFSCMHMQHNDLNAVKNICDFSTASCSRGRLFVCYMLCPLRGRTLVPGRNTSRSSLASISECNALRRVIVPFWLVVPTSSSQKKGVALGRVVMLWMLPSPKWRQPAWCGCPPASWQAPRRRRHSRGGPGDPGPRACARRAPSPGCGA